jgi:hypothetical protein
MKMTEGDLAAWEITAELLPDLDRVDLEFLPDIAETWHTNRRAIGGIPGAFDFDPNIATSTALVIYGVVSTVLKGAAPKLFEAALDVGKEVLKKLAQGHADKAASARLPAVNNQRIHELVRTAVLERKLGLDTADIIANAVIARLAVSM